MCALRGSWCLGLWFYALKVWLQAHRSFAESPEPLLRFQIWGPMPKLSCPWEMEPSHCLLTWLSSLGLTLAIIHLLYPYSHCYLLGAWLHETNPPPSLSHFLEYDDLLLLRFESDLCIKYILRIIMRWMTFARLYFAKQLMTTRLGYCHYQLTKTRLNNVFLITTTNPVHIVFIPKSYYYFWLKSYSGIITIIGFIMFYWAIATQGEGMSEWGAF